MGLEDDPASNHDDIYWNLFPVYAQDMATIVTTQCSFNRRPQDGLPQWKWGAGEADSPVLKYDQLDPDVYRSGVGFNRNPTAEGANSGKNWSDTVNDPSLPNDDAWQKYGFIKEKLL